MDAILTVAVIRGQEAGQRSHGAAPQGVLEVVARAVHCPVLGRALAPNDNDMMKYPAYETSQMTMTCIIV